MINAIHEHWQAQNGHQHIANLMEEIKIFKGIGMISVASKSISIKGACVSLPGCKRGGSAEAAYAGPYKLSLLTQSFKSLWRTRDIPFLCAGAGGAGRGRPAPCSQLIR
ncbi:hypothetical protein EVAR_28822_1 [Eumeta japonica]|uniref:Uncharacterized protein n=1 Tax=Eumeta variegata TaxID=151549 RepID=A0A4C1WID2_EUMVA|nr:hypothetical protein EVAR_28822_1 [Eumeta japonica]